MAISVEKRPLGVGDEQYVVKLYGSTANQDGKEDGARPVAVIILNRPLFDGLAGADQTTVGNYINKTNLDAASYN